MKDDMHTFIFASLRNRDFKVMGTDPRDAWNNLCEREKDNGSIWKTHDKHRNEHAVNNQGFSKLYFESGDFVAYKEVATKLCDVDFKSCLGLTVWNYNKTQTGVVTNIHPEGVHDGVIYRYDTVKVVWADGKESTQYHMILDIEVV